MAGFGTLAPADDGLLEPGNIDLLARPVVKNADGKISTVRSMDVALDGGKAVLGKPEANSRVLIPTVSDDGRILSDQEAVDLYNKTGSHLGKFDTPENATAYAQQLHQDQAKLYAPRSFGSLAPPDIDPLTGLPLSPALPARLTQRTPVDDNYAAELADRLKSPNLISEQAREGLRNWVEKPGRTLWGSLAVEPEIPGKITEGDVFRQDQAARDAATWGAGTAFGMLGVGTPAGMLGPSASAGVFGGRLAKTADTAKRARAEEMASAGAGRDAIWHQTGWFKGADGQWRFEIPDEKASMWGISPENLPSSLREAGEFSKEITGRENRGLRYNDLIQHPDLYAAYPDMPGKMASVYPMKDTRGTYDRTFGILSVDSRLDPWDARTVALHELQHGIQGKEGFATGASPAMFKQQADAKLARDAMAMRREMDQLPAGMDRSAKENAIRDQYKELGAEDWLPSREAWDVAHDRVGNPDETLNKVVRLYGLDKSVTPASGIDLYRRSAGEVEARNVQARKDMTDYERKITPPWKTEDVAPGDQIVMRGGDMSFGSLAPMESRTVDPLYHGSPRTNLEFLNPSDRGPLGPGLYASPAPQIAGSYAGNTGRLYELPNVERDIYRGAGHRTDAEWAGFKADKERLLAAAEPEKRAEISSILDRMWSGDGYPTYQRIRGLYGSDAAAQDLFRRAGFEGVSGLVDGPETVLFGKQSHPILRSGSDDAKGVAAGQVAQATRGERPFGSLAPLPMDEASRMARAADQGYFDRYGRPTQLFHETRAENIPSIGESGFDLGRVGARSGDTEMPNGVFLKRSPTSIGVARGSEVQMPLMHKAASVKEFPDRYELERWLNQNPEYERAALEHRSLNNEYKRKIDDLEKVAWTREKTPESDAAQAQIDALLKEWSTAEDKSAAGLRDKSTELFRKVGYEGVHVAKDTGTGGRVADTTVVFDPAKVRSRFAAFDPANEGKNVILGAGSRDPAQTAVGTVAQATRDQPFSLGGPLPADRGFVAAKAKAAALDAEVKNASDVIRAFTSGVERGPMGLLPDAVKFSPEYRKIKDAYDAAAAKSRAFYGQYNKVFAKELKAERAAKREEREARGAAFGSLNPREGQ